MSTHTYTRVIDSQGRSDIDSRVLADEVIALLPGEMFNIEIIDDECDINFQNDLTVEQVADLDVEVANHKQATLDRLLVAWKESKCDAIDVRTKALIKTGFEFPPNSGMRFSLTLEAQMRVLGCLVLMNSQGFEWPVHWNSVDNTGSYGIADSTVMMQFGGTAAATLRACIDSGSALKSAVRAAQSLAELDTITDTR